MSSTRTHTFDLKKEFEDAHCVQIVSVTSIDGIYTALLNIWVSNEDGYPFIDEAIVRIKEDKIIATYENIFERGNLWKCIYGLKNGMFWLGGGFSSLNSGAKLSLFNEDQLLFSRTFDKGYSTEITKIESSDNDSILITGNWYKCERAGSHDDFYPQRWETKISKDGKDYVEDANPVLNRSYFSHSLLDANSENFYVLESDGISKYSEEGNLIWNQGLGHVGFEKLMPLNNMAPYTKTQNDTAVTDGVWFSGVDYTHSDKSLETPLFGRITAGGTILTHTNILNEFPEVFKIHSLIPGKDCNCLLIGETLRIGEGTGLFFLYVHYSNGIFYKKIKYCNFNSFDLQIFISNIPLFHNRYLNLKEIYFPSSKLEDLTEIIVFGNVNHLQNRDNGVVWTINIMGLFV